MSDPRLEHIVVLMLENRAFDHALGFLKAENPAIDGLTGAESCPLDCAQPGSPAVPVTSAAGYVTRPDGPHDLVEVNVQLFCTETPPAGARPANQGFVTSYTAVAGGNQAVGRRVMDCFDPARLPVLAALAREFAVCDRWFSSVPGPTWPNRFFAHAATSDGIVTMSFADYIHRYGMRTIYDSLDDAGASWRIYFHDIPQSLALSNLRGKRAGFRKIERFAADLRQGDLPLYTFIEPRYFSFLRRLANDQHPPHDMRLGEHLIADVYESLRASALWTRTLLVVLYDEHGGFYDHVAPPAVVAPDAKTSADPPFDFTRAGLRVPAVLVSPYIPRGTVDSTVYEHASLPATVKAVFGLPSFLTDRDRAARPIDTAGWTVAARSDTPATLARPPLPAAAKPLAAGLAAGQRVTAAEIEEGLAAGEMSMEPVSEFQRSLVALAQGLLPEGVELTPELVALAASSPLETEHAAATEVRARVAVFLGQI